MCMIVKIRVGMGLTMEFTRTTVRVDLVRRNAAGPEEVNDPEVVI